MYLLMLEIKFMRVTQVICINLLLGRIAFQLNWTFYCLLRKVEGWQRKMVNDLTITKHVSFLSLA